MNYARLVYSQNVISEGIARQWFSMFRDGRASKVVGWSSVVSDDLVQSVDQRICEGQCFTMSERLCECLQISLSLFYKTITG
jgi:hypothetical protein